MQRVAGELFQDADLVATVVGPESSVAGDGRSTEGLKRMIRALHAPGDGRDLERRAASTRPGSRSSWRPPTRWPRPASCPPSDARELRERAAFDIARIDEIEQTTQHDVIAFTTAVAERVGPSARWLHFGLTSSDVLDTALALQMREACDLILQDIDALLDADPARAPTSTGGRR